MFLESRRAIVNERLGAEADFQNEGMMALVCTGQPIVDQSDNSMVMPDCKARNSTAQ